MNNIYNNKNHSLLIYIDSERKNISTDIYIKKWSNFSHKSMIYAFLPWAIHVYLYVRFGLQAVFCTTLHKMDEDIVACRPVAK
jgi:hypothetical protein